MAHVDFKTKLKGYMNIFYALFALTILEVAVVKVGDAAHLSKMLVGGLVTAMACLKAAMVGYFYMHLNHETKWLKIVSLAPLTMAFYAFVLVLEARIAQIPSNYAPLYTREHPNQSHHTGGEPGTSESPHETVPAAVTPAPAPAEAKAAPAAAAEGEFK